MSAPDSSGKYSVNSAKYRSYKWWTVLVAALVFIIWVILTINAYQRAVEQVRNENAAYIESLVSRIENRFSHSAFIAKAIVSDLRLLTLTTQDIRYEDFIDDAQTAFNRVPDLYQIRIVEQTGQERLRIERDKPPVRLQDKAGRNYLALPELDFGQLYMSAIDLNIENGQIELPYRPTYRISAPLKLPPPFDDLIAVMNFDARPLFAVAQNERRYQMFVARQNGEWLSHPEEGVAFSRQRGLDRNMFSDFPHLKDAIDSGQTNVWHTEWFQMLGYQKVILDSASWFIAPEDNELFVIVKNEAAWLRAQLLSAVFRTFVPLLLSLIVALWLAFRLINSRAQTADLFLELAQERDSLAQKHDDLTQTLANLQLVQEQLIESRKIAALGMMVAGIAHELNTPISGARLSVDATSEGIPILEKKFQSGQLTENDLTEFLTDATESLGLAKENLTGGLALIQRFKSLARNVTAEEAYTFNLDDEFNDLKKTLLRNYPNRPLSLQCQCPEAIEMFSHGFVLRQALHNIIENAIQHGFTDDQEGEINVSVSATDSQVTIEIHDNGRGIPEESLSKVFDPFFSTGRGQGRTGLGLHIVYLWVTRLLQGQITVSSVVGEGTTFRLMLPRTLSE